MNAYEQWQAEVLQETKRCNRRVWLEPLIILIVIFAYCLLQATMQERDHKAELEEENKAQQVTCQIKQYNSIHQFDCTVINKKLAEITQ